MNANIMALAGRSLLYSALLAAGLVSAPAQAQSRVESGSWGPFGVFGDVIADCGDFLVLSDWVESGWFRGVFDKSGNLHHGTVRIEYHESVYYNSEDPSKIIDGGPGEHQMEHFAFGENLFWVTGPIARITLPGQGQILHQGGRVLLDLETGQVIGTSGPQSLEEGDTELLCAALS